MKTTECTPRETLKRYLAGWIDNDESSKIEQHLAQCLDCEKTIVELEDNPDTLLETLRDNHGIQANDPIGELRLDRALSKVKRLMDADGRTEVTTSSVPEVIGMYELIEPLGRGGMATVYLARHRSLGKQVAIKLRPSIWRGNQDVAARFEREIRASGKLNHPAIVNATDAGEANGIQFLVMEYIAGMDVSRVARHVTRIKIADACEIARQAALGLSYAHAEGIVHRDIKPSNLMLDEKGAVKILDFGLAQIDLWDEASAELTSVGQLMGTLDYMAPEQAERSGSVDYRADVYSLGATLFRLLCGRAPLAPAPNLSPLDKLRLLAQHQPPKLATLRTDVPHDLSEFVAEILSRRADERPPSAAHVAERLASFASGADLPGLLAEARRAEAVSGGTEELARRDFAPIESQARSLQSNAGRGNRIRNWLVAAALIPLGMLAAVIVVLETQKGQLVVESQVPNVSVKLLRDGETVDTLKLDVGAKSTRLAAGRYELVIDSPSDSVEVDKNEFIVKSGTTTVARVTQKPTENSTEKSPGRMPKNPLTPSSFEPIGAVGDSPADRSFASEPVYDGRTLAEWLRQLSRDRSPKALGDSLVAIEAMLTPETAARIRTEMLNILPRIPGQTQFEIDGRTRTSVDQKGFDIIANSMGGREYFEMLAEQLSAADSAWAQRLLTPGAAKKMDGKTDATPLVDWLIKNVCHGDQPDAKVLEAGTNWLFSVATFANYEKSQNERIIEALSTSPHLKSGFWLKLPPQVNWPDRLTQQVINESKATIRDLNSPPVDVTRACMVLFAEVKATSPPDEINEIAMSLQARLEIIAEDRSRALTTVELKDSHFDVLTAPAYEFSAPQTSGRRSAGLRFSSRGSSASETQELLDLAFAFKEKVGKEFDARKLMALTEPDYLELRKAIPRSTAWLQFDWPDFRAAQGQGPWGGADQWLAYLFHIQASDLSGTPVPMSEPAAEATPTDAEKNRSR